MQKDLIPFTAPTKELDKENLHIEGVVPEWLQGTLLRTSAPVIFSDFEIKHWFDGPCMLHGFYFREGKIFYSNKFIQSEYYKSTTENKKVFSASFASDEFGFVHNFIEDQIKKTTVDNGNVNINKADGKMLAVTEVPFYMEFDPESLDTRGGVEYHDAITGPITTAHGHYDFDTKESYNYILKMGRKGVYQIFKQAGKKREILACLETDSPSYMHNSFVMTKNYIVFIENPLQTKTLKFLFRTKPFIQNYKWQPEKGTRFTVIKRENGEIVGEYKSFPFFYFHQGNAYEENGKIVMDLSIYKDASIINELYTANIKNGSPVNAGAVGIVRFEIDLQKNQIEHKEIYSHPMEFPIFNYRFFHTKKYQYLYGAATENAGFWNKLIKIDLETQKTSEWQEDDALPGEPVFVHNPNGTGEDDGVLLSVVYDKKKEVSYLVILDAKTMKELSRAWVPQHIPLGFHGNYFSDLQG